MANNWAIAIGINQYQFFQPLRCAQADAAALLDFLVTQAGFSPQQCLLITDTSVPIGDRPTTPTKENILQLIEDLAAACWQPQDRLWFFFSGYGVNYKGQDYLMPVDGNSQRVPESGIEVRELIQSFQIAGLDVLLLLDCNRAFGSLADTRVGLETLEIAQEIQMSTVISCQPEQFSHESSELGHGLFTAALLEALRYGNTSTMANLESYLSVRTPELCHHHWRPTQNPVTVFPTPQKAVLPNLKADAQFAKVPLKIADDHVFAATLTAPKLEETEIKYTEYPEFARRNTDVSRSPQKNFPSVASDSQFGNLLLWSVSTMAVLSLAMLVVLRHQSMFKFENIFSASSNSTTDDVTAIALPRQPQPTSLQRIPLAQSESQQRLALLALNKMSLKPTQASDLSRAIAVSRQIKPGEPRYSQAQQNIKVWNRMIFELALQRSRKQQYADAIGAAQLITNDQPFYSQAQSAIKQWRIQAKQYLSNKTLLNAANALIQSGQASTYNRAIEVAKKVPSGEPGFNQAQKSINGWSEKILQMARTRANRGNFTSAIQTATLVPEGTSAYPEAQATIQKWLQDK